MTQQPQREYIINEGQVRAIEEIAESNNDQATLYSLKEGALRARPHTPAPCTEQIRTATLAAIKALDGPQTNLEDFLEWVADRLVYVHHERDCVDYVLSLRERAKTARSLRQAGE
jgi:hypothetical protein